MTLEEAISHAEEVAGENSKSYEELLACKNRGNVGWSKFDIESVDKSIEQCQKCAEEHRQLAEWLKDYKRLKEQEPCGDAKEEIWKDIPEFEGIYEASNMGRIRSVSRIVRSGKGDRINPTVILKPAIGQWGYEQVCLRKDGKKYAKRVNRLVAQAFIPNPNNLPQVNHIDGDKTNNCVDNLEWCDASYNMKHCFDNRMSDWTTKIRIIETGEVFNSKAECARKIGGHVSLIDMCLKGKRKTHKGYHFEIIGERASDKYNRKNVTNKKDNYESEFKIEYKGEVHSFREWSMITGIKQHTLYTRYLRGDRGGTLFRSVQTERERDKHGKYI